MVWSPASQITMWKPTACQIDMAMIAGSAVDGLPSQSTGWNAPKVSQPSTLFSSPLSPS